MEWEIIKLISKEQQTPKQMRDRLGISKQRINFLLQSLEKKGAITFAMEGIVVNQGGVSTTTTSFGSFGGSENERIRLHGQQLKITILQAHARYGKLLKDCNIERNFMGCTVQMYPKLLEVSIGHSFFGETEDAAFFKAAEFMDRLLKALEGRFKVRLTAPNAMNIKIVKTEYSIIKNGLAKKYLDDGKRLHVYSREDGRLMYLIDNSFSLMEFEGVRPGYAKLDTENASAYFQPIAEGNFIPPDKVKATLEGQAAAIEAQAQLNQKFLNDFQPMMSEFGRNMQAHVSAIQTLAAGFEAFREEFGRMGAALAKVVTPAGPRPELVKVVYLPGSGKLRHNMPPEGARQLGLAAFAPSSAVWDDAVRRVRESIRKEKAKYGFDSGGNVA